MLDRRLTAVDRQSMEVVAGKRRVCSVLRSRSFWQETNGRIITLQHKFAGMSALSTRGWQLSMVDGWPEAPT